jgi:hypothetical protein
MGEVIVNGEPLYLCAKQRANRTVDPVLGESAAFDVKSITDPEEKKWVRSQLPKVQDAIYKELLDDYYGKPRTAGCGEGFHGWLGGATGKLLSHSFTKLTGRKFTEPEAKDFLREVGLIAEVDQVRPNYWEQEIDDTVENILDCAATEERGERGPKAPRVKLNTELMRQLATTYTQAQAIADSPVKYYAHTDDEPNHCAKALEQLFYELHASGDFTLVFAETGDDFKSDFYQRLPDDGGLSDFPFVVPHLMNPKGGLVKSGRYRSKKNDDAVSQTCFGIIEFDWSSKTKNPKLKEFLEYLDANGIAYKDAQMAILQYLRTWGKLANGRRFCREEHPRLVQYSRSPDRDVAELPRTG